jgi:uncharacterized protein (DUF433 family)
MPLQENKANTIVEIPTEQPTVVRTSRGLSVAGTRITLYLLMDHIKGGWSTEEIQQCFRLTDRQMTDVLEYIETHREEFEAEYQYVLQRAEENRQYWEDRNRGRFTEIAAMPPPPGREELWAKLQEWKKRLDQES